MISEKYFSIFKKYDVPVLCEPSYQIYEKCNLAIVASHSDLRVRNKQNTFYSYI